MKFTFQTQHADSNTLLSRSVEYGLIDMDGRHLELYFGDAEVIPDLRDAINRHLAKNVQNMIVETADASYALYVAPRGFESIHGSWRVQYDINAYTKTLNIDKEE